jgi:hypothetical protein
VAYCTTPFFDLARLCLEGTRPRTNGQRIYVFALLHADAHIPKSVFRDRCYSVLFKIHFLVYLGSTTTPIEKTGMAKCRCPRCRKERKSPRKAGKERRVGRKQKLKAGRTEVWARKYASDIYSIRDRDGRDKTRMRVPGAAVRNPNLNWEYWYFQNASLWDQYMRRGPDIIY